MQKFKSVMLALSGLISINCFAQSTKIDVKKGQRYKVETTNKLTSSAEVMGQSMENNTDTKSTTLYEIVNTGPEEIKLEGTLTKMKATASMMGQEMSFDSEKKDNEGPAAELLSKMVNKKKEIKLDNKGTITKQDVTDDEGANSLLTGGTGGHEAATELFIPALIGRELKPGDSFTDISSIKEEKYSSRDSGTYKITAVENGVASISYTGTQVLSVTMEQMGMEMINNTINTVKSEIQVNITTGLVVAKATVTDSIVSIEASGMTIPGKAKTITTINISLAQ